MSTAFSIPTDIPENRAAAQALEDKLADASPTNLADSRAVSTAMQAVRDVLAQLNQEDLLSRDGAMQEAATAMKTPLGTLGGLKDQLTEISAREAALVDIANDVDKVVSGCAKLFRV